MAVIAVKKYKDLLNDMISWVVANQSKLTDFNEGSMTRTIFEAISLLAEQLYIKARVGFEDGLINVPFHAFNFEKDASQKAAGEVVFSRTGTSGTVNIPIGTLVATADGLQFQTTETAEITGGNTDSAATNIQATKPGSLYVVAASTIVIIVSALSGVDSVNNSSATSGGLDKESDSAFLERFQQFIEGLGQANVAGLIAGAKGVSGVRSASVVEHFPPSSSYNVSMYVDDGAGDASQALLDSVEEVIIGDGTATVPGHKAAGINVRVLAPTKVTIAVTVVVDDDGSVSRDALKYQIENAITGYINNLLIGEDCIRFKIVEAIIKVSGVADLTLTLPASNTTIGGTQIARTGVITVSWA